MRILAVAGSSGGHIFPALSFLDELKEKHENVETLLVLPKRSIQKQLMPENVYQIRYILTPKAAFRPGALFKYLLGTAQSLEILLRYKPDLVVGFGSSDSLPLVFLAWLFRIRTMIHEQNVVPGKANRLLAKLVDRVAVSFPETAGYFNINPARISVTGNPIRKGLIKVEKQEALKFFGLADKFTLLVMGGSQGSHRINLALIDALSALDKSFDFQVIHIAGLEDAELVKQGYENLGIRAKVFSFLSEINYAYSASDLVLTRSGASVIYELIFFTKPAILIPYPFAYGHQLKNAQVLEKLGVARIIRDSELDYNILRDALTTLLKDAQRLSKMSSHYKEIKYADSADLLAKLALRSE
ncbi:MAG: undecaprenyldiphospho-muramoylpentapeptide beta-N-acetylglucosaminyltransferase [Candidatus Omnitrophota bacterium]|jgi:UDP-N-acetylglucosamine--N-acetylmuramyl-(pentapeptide) pyrophosphoryl-undecaprenol N-acetylglucosamine transferase